MLGHLRPPWHLVASGLVTKWEFMNQLTLHSFLFNYGSTEVFILTTWSSKVAFIFRSELQIFKLHSKLLWMPSLKTYQQPQISNHSLFLVLGKHNLKSIEISVHGPLGISKRMYFPRGCAMTFIVLKPVHRPQILSTPLYIAAKRNVPSKHRRSSLYQNDP